MGRSQPASDAPTHPITDPMIALVKQSRQSLSRKMARLSTIVPWLHRTSRHRYDSDPPAFTLVFPARGPGRNPASTTRMGDLATPLTYSVKVGSLVGIFRCVTENG